MNRLYAQIASSPSPFVPPPQTFTAHFWRNGRTKRSSDDRPILEAQESTDEFNAGDPNNNLQWKKRKRRHKRRKRWNGQTIWAGANLESTIRLAAFLVCTLLLIMLFLLFIDWTILDQGFANMPAASGPLRWIQLERICSSERRKGNGQNDFTTSCCTVSDIINLEKNSAKRVLFFGNTFQNASSTASVDFESEMALRTPQGKSVWNSDTRLWPLDHGLILNEYVGSMALLPFVFGSFGSGDGDVGEKQRTALVIGLGGGSVDMFWHHKFPTSLNITVYELDPAVVELANRWFGTVNDPTRRTMIGDGIMAIEEAVKEGLHYDTILVDACDHDRSLPCPASQFLLPQTLRNIRAALSPMGTFVVNALPLEAEEVNIRAVQTKLLPTFPTCVRSRMVKEMNNIFACLPYSVDHLEEIVDNVWNKKMAEQIDRLGLRQLLPNVKLII